MQPRPAERARARRRLLCAGLFGAALVALGARADAPEGRWSYYLANELMSPFCPGRTLNDCPSNQAAELKRWILAQETAGRGQAEVEADLYSRYGDVILQAPRATGFGLAAYALPVAAVVAGAALVVTFLRRQGARGGGADGSGPAPSRAAPPAAEGEPAALEAALDAELAGRP